MKKWIIVVLTLAVLLAACGTPAATPVPAQPTPPGLPTEQQSVMPTIAVSKLLYDLALRCHARMLLSGIQFDRRSGFPPKARGNDTS